MKRNQESVENHHKIFHTSAKHYFGVAWTHLGAFRAVKRRFPVIFHGFARFFDPRPGGVAADGFPSNFYEKTEVNLKRDHGSIGNHHKIMHTSAKHYFEVVWTHLGVFRAVQS